MNNIGGIQILVIICIATAFAIIIISYLFYQRSKRDVDDLENDENLNKLRL
jgi:purine-cytosine permease-like protein